MGEDTATYLHGLSRHNSKILPRTRYGASLLPRRALQDLDVWILTSRIQDRAVTTGVELQENRPGSGAGQSGRHYQSVHVGQFILRMLGTDKRDAFATDTLAHHAGFVETKQSMRVIDKQVEVGEK